MNEYFGVVIMVAISDDDRGHLNNYIVIYQYSKKQPKIHSTTTSIPAVELNTKIIKTQ